MQLENLFLSLELMADKQQQMNNIPDQTSQLLQYHKAKRKTSLMLMVFIEIEFTSFSASANLEGEGEDHT